MRTVTTAQARRTAANTTVVVDNMTAKADALEAAGSPTDIVDTTWNVTRAEAVAALRTLAVSRAQAGARVRPGARVRRAA